MTTARQDRRPHPLARVSRGFALFMNWFDGICSVVCGGFMAASGLVALKDMRRGEQVSCTPDEAAEKIKTALAESAGTPLIKEK